jgi:hypothetical protein
MGHITEGIPEGFVTTYQVIEATGIGEVQLHRWCHKGIIPFATIFRNRKRPALAKGQGTVRIIPDNAIPRIALAMKIQNVFEQVPGKRLRQIMAAYPSGKIEYDGFTITWNTEEQQHGSS